MNYHSGCANDHGWLIVTEPDVTSGNIADNSILITGIIMAIIHIAQFWWESAWPVVVLKLRDTLFILSTLAFLSEKQ